MACDEIEEVYDSVCEVLIHNAFLRGNVLGKETEQSGEVCSGGLIAALGSEGVFDCVEDDGSLLLVLELRG